LAESPWPAGLVIYEAGIAVMNLWDVFIKNRLVIIIDALYGGQKPGTIYRLTPEEMDAQSKETRSLHDLGVMDIINMAAWSQHRPQVIIYGMEPGELTPEIGLSEHIRERLPALVECVRQELTSCVEKYFSSP
jgi:hydrogenase maturation protease